MSRPRIWDGNTIVALDGVNSKTVPRASSKKKAIILQLVEFGGRATLDELSDHFGFDVQQEVQNLLQDGWVVAAIKGKELPRRPKRLSAE